MNTNAIIDAKITTYELVKDSPLFLYAAFYDPIHSWLYNFVTEFNPFVEFLLNILALGYGIYRVVAVIKRWLKKEDPKDTEDEQEESGQVKLF